MKTRFLVVVLVFLVLTAFTTAVWSQCVGGKCTLPGKSVGAVKCPVDAKAIKDSAKAPKSMCNGMTYRFCSSACKAKFDKSPAKYGSKCPASCIDPVTGKRLSPSAKGVVKSVYKGKTYCFATAASKARFDKNPQKYVVKPAGEVVSAVCPVMGNRIPDVSKAPGGKSVYKGKTYYFCCPGCKTSFDKNPEKYLGGEKK